MNLVYKIRNIVDKLVFIRDKRCESLEEKDTMADACNLLDNLASAIKPFVEEEQR